ncbi:hypothetical protein ACIQVO_38170 [Streptomyces sp. NPDC101062]|uniref:hypothetical protein n=1 Tax=unclassified Streptomyces TaxID=2593676 RepID=UPI003811D07D
MPRTATAPSLPARPRRRWPPSPSPSPGPPPPPGPDNTAPAPVVGGGPARRRGTRFGRGSVGLGPRRCALGCLLEYAAAVPGDVPDLVAGALAACAGDEAVAGAVGVRLPVLHRHAGEFTAAHPELYALTPGRPSLAAAWLRWAAYDPLLLTALGPRRGLLTP